MTQAIVGRDADLAAIAGFLDGETWPRTLLIAGEAGMGKTTLWRAGTERAEADGRALLAARPLETETKLAYAGVGDLLASSHDAFEELPPPQAQALRAALLLETSAGESMDERAVSLGFLGVLRVLAQARPVLVAVDDLQWLDHASTRVLLFAARRLAERVGFLLAMREEARGGLMFAPEQVFPDYAELRVEPLGLEDVHAIVQQRLGLSLSRPTLRSVHETSAGNPFFALELARASAEGGASLASTLRELVGARIAALPAETRSALAAAAALADPTLDLVGAAIGREADEALAVALEREVVGVSDGRIRFAHPLLAAAAYASAGTRVRDLHTVLAGLVRAPEERARHLALGARGPDADVAAALDEAAGLAKARGAPIAAAELLEKARALTPADDPAASRRAVAAARRYFEAGDARRARALLDDALPELAGVERAEALIALANVRSYDDDIQAAVELLEEAIAVGAAEPRVAGAAHELLAGIFFRLRERLPESVDHARAAVAIARNTGDEQLLAGALGAQLVSEATVGRPEAPETLAAALAVGDAGQATRVMGGAGFQVAVVHMWWEQLDEAVAGFAVLRGRAELIGDESSIPYTDVLLAQAECLRGDLTAAAAYASEAAARAEQAGQETLAAYGLALRALTAAYAGEEELARTAARQALERAGSTTGRPAEQFATAALGLLELSLERDAEAVEALAPLVSFARGHELREPGLTRFVPDLVEALVGLGRLDEAEDSLAWYTGNAERLRRRSALGSAARGRGFVSAARGDTETAATCFEEAVAHHREAPIPFDRGRSLLALGAARRRAKERRAARESLLEARELFGGLGARLWEQRAAVELARIGGRAPSAGELTPVERRVAELGAAGRSNKEVAGALYLSTRTVEGHLSRVYAKLGVRSRVELARKLA